MAVRLPIAPRLLALAAAGLPDAPPAPRDGWSSHLDAVIAHGLAGLLAEANDTGAVELDGDARARLDTRLEAEAVQAVRLEAELLRLSPLIETCGGVVLKGAVLAHGAYASPALRPFTDIDLLVPNRSLGTAMKALSAHGYTRPRPDPSPAFAARIGKATVFVHPDGPVVDLHRTLVAGPGGDGIDVDAIVDHRVAVAIGAITLAAPDWDAHLLEAVLHAIAGDRLRRALSLRDVAQVARHAAVEPSRVIELAHAWGLAPTVASGLRIAHEALGVAVPRGFQAFAADALVPDGTAFASHSGRGARLDDILHGPPRRRLTALRSAVAPDPAFLRWAYGDAPVPALYWRRWRDVARRARGGAGAGDVAPMTLATPPTCATVPPAIPDAIDVTTPDRAVPAARAGASLPAARLALPAPAPRLALPVRAGPVAPGPAAPAAAPATDASRPAVATLLAVRPAGVIASGTVDPAAGGAPWWRYRRPLTAEPHTIDPSTVPASAAGVPGPPPRPPGVGGGDGGGSNDGGSEGAHGDGVGPRWHAGLDLAGNASTGVGLAVAAIAVLAIVSFDGRSGPATVGRWLIPIAALLIAASFGRRFARTHADEPWLGRWLLLGVLAKVAASYFRYMTLVNSYGGVGDASGYDSYGRQFAGAWLHGLPSPDLPDLRKTNFIRWFTGVVYWAFGSDMLAGFFVFGLLALVGSYLWYRATVESIPFVDRRLYLAFVLFAPSIAFWPSSIGKEALMQLGIGVVALGTANLLRNRLVQGLAISAAGGWLLWVVRPHLLALVAFAGGVAYIGGRVRRAQGVGSLVSRPVGMIVVAILVAFTLSQGAKFLGMEDLSLDSIQAELDEQTARSDQGGSSFDNGGNSLSPLSLPHGAMTVLLRPFPWETDSALQLLASLESAVFALLLLVRFGSVRAAVRRARDRPFLLYCWVLLALYSATFSSFANFGLLVRQRSLVLPALFVVLAVDAHAERRDRIGHEEEQRVAA